MQGEAEVRGNIEPAIKIIQRFFNGEIRPELRVREGALSKSERRKTKERQASRKRRKRESRRLGDQVEKLRFTKIYGRVILKEDKQ